VLPVRAVEGLKSLQLYPGSRKKRSKYEKWREAWEILRGRARRGRKGGLVWDGGRKAGSSPRYRPVRNDKR
jgi:hypothetical protein